MGSLIALTTLGLLLWLAAVALSPILAAPAHQERAGTVTRDLEDHRPEAQVMIFGGR